MRLKKTFELLLLTTVTLASLSATAGIGDKYICISSQYMEIKKDGEVNRYRPVKFEILWDSPKNSTEEILWIPSHPELIMSEVMYLIEKQPDPTEKTGEYFRFNLHPLQNSNIKNTSGLWTNGTMYLTFSAALVDSITAVIASCTKRAS